MKHIGLASIVCGLALSGCGVQTACTLEARSSVTLSVVDQGGAPVPGASAVATVDGGEPFACDEASDGALICGFELDGAFSITVSAPGFADETVEVDVGRTADDCHVESEALDVTLTAV